ncbi:NAD(P)/FAD-dependent oxidoreductase [Rhodococcoides kyotonense]|uniref:Sarcosine oxidase subunit beta n=1 Tax=Rhodococcoides kyotonense TaxID=398843 RepID=A0A239MJG5_9NOCA|nr:FAD-dependent oxidoreductase [Rhodococcus kyotonensis]SNT42264.1 sarcosine oxidase subunit beta [Rhodococcus kyotonensis]
MRADVDAVVVGAGIVGAATALALVRAGSTVAIVDRAQANTQGSGTTAGNLHIQTIHTRRPGQGTPVDVKQLLPLQYATSTLWNTLSDSVPGLGLNRCGGYMIAETDEQVRTLHEKHEWETAAGIPTEVLSGDDARRALPLLGPGVQAATWCDWDGFAEPDLATPALMRQAIVEGATFYPDTPVTSLEQTSGGWRVSTRDHTWNSRIVVDAAGPWMADIAALACVYLDLRPTSLQMHTLSAAPGTLDVLVQHVGEGMSVKQDRRDRIVLGGGWPAGPFHTSEKAPLNSDSTTGSRAQISRVLPSLGQAPLLDAWTGPVVTTPDEMPVIGGFDSAPGLFVAGGTYSFTFAPLWAEILTSLALGNAPVVDVDAFSPARLVATTTH